MNKALDQFLWLEQQVVWLVCWLFRTF